MLGVREAWRGCSHMSTQPAHGLVSAPTWARRGAAFQRPVDEVGAGHVLPPALAPAPGHHVPGACSKGKAAGRQGARNGQRDQDRPGGLELCVCLACLLPWSHTRHALHELVFVPVALEKTAAAMSCGGLAMKQGGVVCTRGVKRSPRPPAAPGCCRLRPRRHTATAVHKPLPPPPRAAVGNSTPRRPWHMVRLCCNTATQPRQPGLKSGRLSILQGTRIPAGANSVKAVKGHDTPPRALDPTTFQCSAATNAVLVVVAAPCAPEDPWWGVHRYRAAVGKVCSGNSATTTR